MKQTRLLINQLLVIQIRQQKGLGGKFGRIPLHNYPLLTFILILFLGASCDQQAAAPSATPSLTALAQTNTQPIAQTATVVKPTAAAAALITPSPSPTAEPTQTPTLTPTPVSVSEPCGQQLPIRLPAEQSTHEWSVPPLADNIIPNDVLPALEYFFANPNNVSLTVYRLGYEGIGFYHNADQPMPLASVSKLIELVAYANAVEAETVDPLQTIEVDDLNRYYLPRSDLGAHNASLRELDSTTLTLDEVAWMMIRHSANSASDYLHDRLGQAVIEQTAVELGFMKHSAPCPWIGRFLTMGNPTRTSSNIAAIEQLTTSPDRYANEVVWLSERYTTDAQFRQTAQRYWANRQAPLNAQRAFIEQLETRGTTREYAHLMAQIVTQQAGNTTTRELLNWPLEQFPSNSERYASIGYKNGTFPGVLTTVYYAEPYWADTPIVLALFFNDIPNRTYQGWRRSFPHDDMAHWLMSNPSAIHIMHVLRDSAEKK